MIGFTNQWFLGPDLQQILSLDTKMKLKLLIISLLTTISIAYTQITSCEEPWYYGEGTYYGGVAGGAGGHCGIPIASGDIYHCAMNHEQYAGSNACGSCVRILGPKGEVVLKVADECPECKFGDIDLTTGVYPQIAELKDGRVKIKWQYVPCPLANDITLVFAPGSGPYYFKAQVRDAFYPISKLEYRKSNGTYDSIHRVVYNYFVKPDGIDEDKSKAGPYTFRFTSFTGEVIEASNIIFNTNDLVHTGIQFTKLSCPDCAGEINGTAKIDFCNVCSGGNTGITPNSSCKKDCAGYWNENAYIDGCGKCVAGTTGATPCDNDCNGDPGGLAYLDQCGKCVGGKTGLSKCSKDCNNDWGGTASIDSCDMCAGGNTSRIFQFDKDACGTTSIQDTDEKMGLNSSSNLFQDQITIEVLGDFEYTLYSISGTLIEKGVRKNTLTIGHNAPEGIYLLSIKSQNGILIKKLIKQH